MEQNDWLQQLYEDYSVDIFHFALSIVHNQHVAEDVMQDTFLKAYQKYSSFQRKNADKAWLFRIAQRTAYDYLRHKKYEADIEYAEAMDVLSVGCGSRELDAWEVICMLDLLQEPDRTIVRMKILGGLSHKEISRATRRSIHSVKKRYERAIKKLRNQYEEE